MPDQRRLRAWLAAALAAAALASAGLDTAVGPGAGGALAAGATSTSIDDTLSSSTRRAAHRASSATVLTINGGPIANRVVAFIGSTGRLMLTSAEGIDAPATPAGQCTQDTTQQISSTRATSR